MPRISPAGADIRMASPHPPVIMLNTGNGGHRYACHMTAVPAPEPTTHHALREATAADHARLDAQFARGLPDRAAYAIYLRGMHRYATDHACVLGLPPAEAAWLVRDLAALALSPLPPRGSLAPVRDRHERLGWEYVMAGSSMGARMLLRQVQALGLDETHGAHFLSRHAANSQWAQVRARLEACDRHNIRAQAQLQYGARAAFALAQSCFDSAREQGAELR